MNATSCVIVIFAKERVVKPRLWSTPRGVSSIEAPANVDEERVRIEGSGQSWSTSRLISSFPASGEWGKSGVLMSGTLAKGVRGFGGREVGV